MSGDREELLATVAEARLLLRSLRNCTRDTLQVVARLEALLDDNPDGTAQGGTANGKAAGSSPDLRHRRVVV